MKVLKGSTMLLIVKQRNISRDIAKEEQLISYLPLLKNTKNYSIKKNVCFG